MEQTADLLSRYDLTPWSCGLLLSVCDCYQDLGKDGDGNEQTVDVEPCDLNSPSR